MAKKVKAKFIEPMLLLRTDALPNGREQWEYELKGDGYRAIAFRTGGKLHLRSRNNNDFTPHKAEDESGRYGHGDDCPSSVVSHFD
jgi:ATP-dependent DNA ligase